MLASAASVGWRARDRRSEAPVVPAAAFRDRAYSVSMMIAFINSLGPGATLFASALRLQDLPPTSPVSAPTLILSTLGTTAMASRQLGQSTGVATGGLLLGTGLSWLGARPPEAYGLVAAEIALAGPLVAALPSLRRRAAHGIAARGTGCS